MLVTAPAALGFAGHAVQIKGPSSVKIGKKFTFKLSGFTGKFVNELVVLEASSKCVPTYTQEAPASPSVATTSLRSQSHFTYTVHLKAKRVGKHWLCGYLINQTTRLTYADAIHKWTDHS
jgi:hypothetical protein